MTTHSYRTVQLPHGRRFEVVTQRIAPRTYSVNVAAFDCDDYRWSETRQFEARTNGELIGQRAKWLAALEAKRG